ncbi:MAG: class I SAM-dependent methyltransferase, partial [Anaerolineales bacterium]
HPQGIPGLATYIYNRLSRSRIFQQHYDLVARDVLDYCPDGAILDVGTGPARLLVALHRRAPDLELFGVDISPGMVERAKENLRQAGIADRVEMRAADVCHLPFEDERFDAVVSTGSIHHWKDPLAGLIEVHRVLKPGGYALISDLVADTPQEVLKETRREHGRLRMLLLWLHSFEEPFYNADALAALAPQSPFERGVVRFVGALCCLTMRKGRDD